MCLAQGQNAVLPVRLEPATTQSLVKHSTTEPLHYMSQMLHSSSTYILVVGISTFMSRISLPIQLS